jgi:hypothetical protein
MMVTRRNFLMGFFTTTQVKRETTTSALLSTGAPDPIRHLLNRITWGPHPEEIARAREIGYEAYLDEQLNPERIDDSQLDERLRQVSLLNLDRHTIYSVQNSEYRSYQAVAKGMVWRAAYSRRQLLERVVEFWSDHFNVSGEDYMADNLVYQREAIRKNALGNFRDMLIATAKSPAMLFYLDNFINYAEAPNENYARELLELHTLGVDGGYTEQDVKEAARAFTGWTVHNGTRTGFYFNSDDHDDGPKVVLGHKLPAGRGIEDGLHVLSIAASHPTTARFVSSKLARHFVSDDPPLSLIDSMTQVWQSTNGDIKSVLRHLFLSEEFLASTGQKLRRPLDFFIGALRATGTELTDWWALEQMLMALGQMPYGWGPPDGYPDVAEAWMSTNGLLARWNVAMQLTHSAYEDHFESGYGLGTTQLYERIGQPQTAADLVDAVASQVFGAPLADPARFIDYVTDGGDGETTVLSGADIAVTPHLIARKLASLYGLMLASPQFQWR